MNSITGTQPAGLLTTAAWHQGPDIAPAPGSESFAALLRRTSAADTPEVAGDASLTSPMGQAGQPTEDGDSELKHQFTTFVGQTLFGQLFKAMRSSLGKPAYFHGGRTEEVFQQQLDQVLADRMTLAQGGRYAQAMYDLQFGNDRGANFSASL